MGREAHLKWLQENSAVSVVIVGAGINGIGTFRDLALQGVDVLMVDKRDFLAGASSASSRMVHGGIRYLENAEFRLVREAVKERNRLIENAPQYVNPLPTTIPIFKTFSGFLNAPLKFLGLLDRPSERGLAVIKIGLMAYDAYTGDQGTVPKHQINMREKSLQKFPKMHPDILCTATYYDGAMRNPERIGVELILDAQEDSDRVHAINYMSAVGAEGNRIKLRDELSGEMHEIETQLIINATGPWIDFANDRMGLDTRFIGGTKGSHLILDHPELREAIGENEIFFENSDGRIVLIYPIYDKVIVGTSDLEFDQNPDNAMCTEEEIDYFFGMIPRVFPTIHVDRSHIIYTYSGVRPLPAGDVDNPGQISRDHSIEVVEPGDKISVPIYNLVGGKWTSFRAFSEEVADETLEHLGLERKVDTKEMAIGGGREYPRGEAAQKRWIAGVAEDSGLDFQRVADLFDRYGTRAAEFATYVADGEDAPLEHRPDYTRREIRLIMEKEDVMHVTDLILRRTLLASLGKVNSGLVTELANLLGDLRDWPAQRRQEEVDRTHETLARQHRIRLGDEKPVLA